MPCYFFSAGEGGFNPSSSGYATEEDCLNACKEGACCEGTTCSIKPQCQCQGAGQVFKGVGTVCSPDTCQTCPCVNAMPTAVVFRFSNFAYSWFGSSSNATDMSIYAAELADFQESYQITVPRIGFSAGSHATYSLHADCYTVNTCTSPASCVNAELRFLRTVQLALQINCNETISGLYWNLVSARACWQQFANNRTDYVLRVVGGHEAASVSNLIGPRPMSVAYPFCGGNSWELDVEAPNNSPVLGQTNFYAQWSGGVFSENWGNYLATSGTLSLSPVFGNPLP